VAPSIDNVWNLGFRIQFSVPSSGNFSNVSTTKFASFFRDFLKSRFIVIYLTIILIFEKIPEEGSRNSCRNT